MIHIPGRVNSQYFHQKHTYNSRPRPVVVAAASQHYDKARERLERLDGQTYQNERERGCKQRVLYESSGRIWQRGRPVVAIYSRITLLPLPSRVCQRLICIISAPPHWCYHRSLIRYGTPLTDRTSPTDRHVAVNITLDPTAYANTRASHVANPRNTYNNDTASGLDRETVTL